MVAVGLLTASSAFATVALPLGGTLYKPGFVPPGSTAYSTQLPACCIPANLQAELTSTIQSPPQGPGFHGTITSSAYRNPAGSRTFTYVFRNDGPGNDPVIVAASFLKQDWLAPAITDAGSDGQGLSGTNDTPEWTTGDPYQIFRGPDGLLEFDWRIGTTGTVIGPANYSATIWLQTDAFGSRQSTLGLADGGAIGQALILVAPEPLTLTLLAAAGTILLRRRPRDSAQERGR